MSGPGLLPLRTGCRGRRLAVTPPITTSGPRCLCRSNSTQAVQRLPAHLRASWERLNRKSELTQTQHKRTPIESPMETQLSDTKPVQSYSRPRPIRLLMKAISERQDLEIWDRYTKIISDERAHRYLRRSDYETLIMSLQPSKIMTRQARTRRSPTGQTVVFSRPYTYHNLLRARFNKIHNWLTVNHPGFRYTLEEYNRWLEVARAGKDWSLATRLWQLMLLDHRIRPNVKSYNTYLSNLLRVPSHKRWRIAVEYNLARRRIWSNGPGGHQKPSAPARATALLQKMLENGVAPDTMTMNSLIQALGYVGDFDSVNTTLKNIWDVDVAAIQEGTAPLTTTMKPDAPNYPNSHTLAILTKIYGSAGEVSLALNVINYMSEVFKIPITLPTWNYLLNWTYTWANTKKYPRTVKFEAVPRLWEVMTAPPYNIKPTFRMYDYLIRNTIRMRRTNDAQRQMREACKLYEKERQRYEAAVSFYETSDDVGASVRAEAEARKLEVELAIKRSMIKRWVELLVYGRQKAWQGDYAVRGVPKILLEWSDFVNKRIMYVTKTGFVELIMHEEGWKPIPIRRPRLPKKEPRTWLSQRGATWGEGAKEEDIF